MPHPEIGVLIRASHPHFRVLIEPTLRRFGIAEATTFRHGVAQLLLDFPLTWALHQLEHLHSFERSHTLLVTQSTHAVYLDTLASHHLSSVVTSTEETAILSGIYAAAAAQRTYHHRSGLTYMELRVTRLLLKGLDTKDLADRLGISYKTVNAHVSNILGKLGYESRAQYIANLLGHYRTDPLHQLHPIQAATEIDPPK